MNIHLRNFSNVSKQLNNEKTNIFNVPHNRNACFM